MEKLILQPNGKYCCIDWWGKIIFYNYTEQDVIDLYIEQAKEKIVKAHHFGKIIEARAISKKQQIDDKTLELMGFEEPYKELVKYVPLEPLNIEYVECDFTTYGKCPSCNGIVKDGIGGKDKKCQYCDQQLKW